MLSHFLSRSHHQVFRTQADQVASRNLRWVGRWDGRILARQSRLEWISINPKRNWKQHQVWKATGMRWKLHTKKQLSTASRDLSLFALCSTPHPLPTSKRWFSNSEKCSLNLYIILGGLRVIRFLWRGSIVPQPRQMDQGSNITLMYHNKMLCIPCSPGVIFWGMVQLYNYKMHVQSISDTCSFHQILNGSLCKSDATNW